MKRSKLVNYNQAVLAELQAKSPALAQTLNSRGSSLGWWDTINYWYTKGVKPEFAADRIVDMAENTASDA
jgi:hypothetical protein